VSEDTFGMGEPVFATFKRREAAQAIQNLLKSRVRSLSMAAQ
jgi:hypothetical protein